MVCQLFKGSGDYDKSLRHRCWAALGLTALGLVGLVCYLLLVRSSRLSDYAQGFYFGASCGLIAAGLVLLARTWRLIRDPDARKQAKIREKDERSQHIVNESAHFAGIFTLYACMAALFVLAPISMAACMLLVGVAIIYLLSFLAAHLWLSKKL